MTAQNEIRTSSRARVGDLQVTSEFSLRPARESVRICHISVRQLVMASVFGYGYRQRK